MDLRDSSWQEVGCGKLASSLGFVTLTGGAR